MAETGFFVRLPMGHGAFTCVNLSAIAQVDFHQEEGHLVADIHYLGSGGVESGGTTFRGQAAEELRAALRRVQVSAIHSDRA